MIKLVKLSSLLILFACAQVTSLNLKKHQFGKIPTKIIWIQVAGLSSEHLAMLKFSYPKGDQKTSFENALCIGSTWDYNLYKIRPSAYEGFLSQITGKKNIKNECSDYSQKPIWKYIGKKGYKIGILEGEMTKKQSLMRSLDCKQGDKYLDEVTLWKMSKKAGKQVDYFHINEKINYKNGKKYYDKSCLTGDCFTSISHNVEGTFKTFSKNSKNYLYIVRNFNYMNFLKQNKVKQARAELIEINSMVNYFQKIAQKSSDVLVLISSAGAIDLEFPTSGKQWKDYERGKRKLRINNSKLLSSVYASGARAENFCGIFDQNQILSRIFSGSKQQGLEFSIINPFK